MRVVATSTARLKRTHRFFNDGVSFSQLGASICDWDFDTREGDRRQQFGFTAVRVDKHRGKYRLSRATTAPTAWLRGPGRLDFCVGLRRKFSRWLVGAVWGQPAPACSGPTTATAGEIDSDGSGMSGLRARRLVTLRPERAVRWAPGHPWLRQHGAGGSTNTIRGSRCRRDGDVDVVGFGPARVRGQAGRMRSTGFWCLPLGNAAREASSRFLSTLSACRWGGTWSEGASPGRHYGEGCSLTC